MKIESDTISKNFSLISKGIKRFTSYNTQRTTNNEQSYKTIVLVGQPNCGKSTLFNVLSEIKSATSNFAGTTVKLKKSLINLNGDTFCLVDLPGTYSLNPSDKAEEVTYNYLLNNNVDLIINVVDSSLLARSLELTVELIELGIPMVIAMNMQDEADRHGIKLNPNKLQELLNTQVVTTSALYGKGIKTLTDTCYNIMYEEEHDSTTLHYTHHIEVHIDRLREKIARNLNGYNGSDRFFAIKSIENPDIVPNDIINLIGSELDYIEKDLFQHHHKDSFETVSYERHHLAMKIAEATSTLSSKRHRLFSEKLDDYLLNPVAGYLFLGIFFVSYFFAIFIVGDYLTNLISVPLDFAGTYIDNLKQYNMFLWFTVNGAWQGLVGAVGIVLPYFLPLVFLTSIFEDTGYLARIAFLIDALMNKAGLHGKSVVAFILGFACSVPAIYSTRIMENKTERMLTAILIPFIPCSARISVIFALTAAFTGPIWAFIIFIFVMVMIGINGKLISKFISNPIGLILEIPSLKTPSFKIIAHKTWLKIKDFIRSATLFLILGSIALGWVEYFNVGYYINYIFTPVLNHVLGLPEQLASVLLFGFFRKELIIAMASQALGVSSLEHLPLTIEQVIVFIVFVTLYFPCFTTFVVIWKEFGAKVVTASAILSIIVATVSAFMFKIMLNLHIF